MISRIQIILYDCSGNGMAKDGNKLGHDTMLILSIYHTGTYKSVCKFWCWLTLADPKSSFCKLYMNCETWKTTSLTSKVSHSVASLEAKANVCCVKFNPNSCYHLAFGSADHCVHYYDLRSTKQPLNIFRGKAVSIKGRNLSNSFKKSLKLFL